ncbi:MarR family transcriptional regulator [Candidatus Woesearchaeota archaeon]|nr:MarR family transcriptional regulator [Candidatus Woesearchaeota archaeon]
MNTEILKELGLTNNEITVYLTLLQTGSVSVNTIAERSGLHRQAVYDALDRLLEKGFVSFVVQQNKKHFQGIHPEKIMDMFHQKEQKIQSFLPELIALTHLPREDTFVELIKGREVIRTVYRDIIKTLTKKPGEILISGVDERKFFNEDPIALDQHINRLRKLNCTERVLVKEGDRTFVTGRQTTYRWVPAAYFHATPMMVYQHKLTIIIMGTPNYAIMIENKDLADAYRKQFNLLWRVAKPLDR